MKIYRNECHIYNGDDYSINLDDILKANLDEIYICSAIAGFFPKEIYKNLSVLSREYYDDQIEPDFFIYYGTEIYNAIIKKLD